MIPRIADLRQQSLDAKPSVSAERALLVTEYYQSDSARKLAPAALFVISSSTKRSGSEKGS